MHKRVLIVEAADAIRSVAENVLRQNGYEVISVAGAEKALEVLGFSVPDIVIVGADVTCEDKRPLYEKIMSDPKTSSIPMLFFAGTEKNDLPYPEEVIIPRPFDPQDLIQRVRIFSGQSVPDEKKTASNPLGEGSLDDELLDAALGIDTKDNIQVTDSEVLGQTTQIRIGHKKPKKASDKLIGFDHYEDENDDENHTHIESLMIEEENSEIKKKPAKPIPPPNSGTSKLEIMNDQYGLVDPDAFKDENVDKDHDYDWFINSMREDNENPGKKTSPPEGDSGKMSFTENSPRRRRHRNRYRPIPLPVLKPPQVWRNSLMSSKKRWNGFTPMNRKRWLLMNHWRSTLRRPKIWSGKKNWKKSRRSRLICLPGN